MVWWIVHVILVIGALVGLYWLQKSGRIPVQSPWPQIREYWLVILGLLVYAILWIAWWIWKLLADEIPSNYPDIDAAWEEAKAALGQAGIDVRSRPLFLVVGRPESGERNLFDAAQFKMEVKPTPSNPRAACAFVPTTRRSM